MLGLGLPVSTNDREASVGFVIHRAKFHMSGLEIMKKQLLILGAGTSGTMMANQLRRREFQSLLDVFRRVTGKMSPNTTRKLVGLFRIPLACESR